jgi:hypothetical protein
VQRRLERRGRDQVGRHHAAAAAARLDAVDELDHLADAPRP